LDFSGSPLVFVTPKNSEVNNFGVGFYWEGIESTLHWQKNPLELIAKAISRAKQRDTNRSSDLPQIWSTTVYKLVEKIIES